MTDMHAEALRRYRQARLKAHIKAERALRAMLEGRADYAPCTLDLERAAIIEAIGKAYEDGRRAGVASS